MMETWQQRYDRLQRRRDTLRLDLDDVNRMIAQHIAGKRVYQEYRAAVRSLDVPHIASEEEEKRMQVEADKAWRASRQ